MKHYDELGNVVWAHHKQTKAATTATNMAPGYGASATGERNTLLPAYQSILNNPGYSDKDKSAMRLSTLGGLGASYGSAQDTAMNRMARTGNTAGFGETLDELARSRGRDTATAEAGLESKFADTALSERDKALGGIQGMYGVDTETLAKLLGIGTSQYRGLGGDILTTMMGNAKTAAAGAAGA